MTSRLKMQHSRAFFLRSHPKQIFYIVNSGGNSFHGFLETLVIRGGFLVITSSKLRNLSQQIRSQW